MLRKKRKKRQRRPSGRTGQLSSSTMCYIAYSDGKKMIYTNKDRAPGVNSSLIPNPRLMTFSQLFINGILQPACNYSLAPGKITLLTSASPLAGSSIILQSICLRVLPSNPRFSYAGKSRLRQGGHRKKKSGCPRKSGAAAIPDKLPDNAGIGMPPSLIKAFATATSAITGTIATTTRTSVADAAKRLNAVVTAAMINPETGTTMIPAASFTTDTGEALTGSIPAVNPGGFYDLFINGVLQQGCLSSLSEAALTITSADILEGTPVNVEIHDYSGTSSESSSVPLLAVRTSIET